MGEPTHFIRLTGCSLRCEFCDTRHAWEGGQVMTPSGILDDIAKKDLIFPAEWICLTGGEPLEQDLGPLLEEAKRVPFKIQIETNGRFFQEIPVDWYTISPKPDDFFVHPEYPARAREVKIVVTRDLGLDRIISLRRLFPEKVPIFLQPQSMLEWSLDRSAELLRESLQAGLRNIMLGLQLHKIFNIL